MSDEIYKEAETRREYNWEAIRDSMKTGVVLVTFRKVSNNELRTMECTLADYLLPETSENPLPTRDPDVVTVFDIEKNGWRAFRKSTVVDVEVL